MNWGLLFSFLITFFIELLVYFLIIKDKIIKIIGYCFLINLFTWPLANLFYGLFGYFYLIEFFVILIEFFLLLFLFDIKWERALTISLVANIITATLGFLI